MRLNNIFRSVVGSLAQEYRLNIIANNLANTNTPGFKKDIPIFRDYMLKATSPDFSQGQLRKTGGTFDLALNGPGFFQIKTPFGIRYTRNGAFTLTSEGTLVSQDGYPVQGELNIPGDAKEVIIEPNGEVLADNQSVGTIEITEFEDLKALKKEGNNYFVPVNPQITGKTAEKTSIEQGYLEMSNVSAVTSMINLIDTTRTYEAYQKLIHAFEDADSKVINQVGSLI